jgi:hypothetical protein
MKFRFITLMALLLLVGNVWGQSALVKGPMIEGDGLTDDPYRWTAGPIGVSRNCNVFIWDGTSWIPKEISSAIVLGQGKDFDPYHLADQIRGLVCDSAANPQVQALWYNDALQSWSDEFPLIVSGDKDSGVPFPDSPLDIADDEPQSGGCRSQACKELDEVWRGISKFIDVAQEKKGRVWDPLNLWQRFSSNFYVRQQVTSSTKPTPVVTVDKNKIVQVARGEFTRWDSGDLHENDPKAQTILNKYAGAVGWQGDWNPGTAWSAIFISWVMQDAGVTFPGSALHTKYFSEVRDNPGSCQALPMNEIGNLKAGDILCRCRDCQVDFSDVSSQPGHCDIVTAVNGNDISLVGGNVHSSVCGSNTRIGCTVNEKTVSRSGLGSSYFGYITCGSSRLSSSSSVGSSVSSTGTAGFVDYNFDSGVSFSDTSQLQKAIDKANSAGIDACYPLVAMLFESKGDVTAIGVDANVRNCNVHSRRKFIVNTLSSQCTQFATSGGLDRLKDSCNLGLNNPCVRAIKDNSYLLTKPTQADFCANNYDPQYTYGIGLGQITPSSGARSVTIGGNSYNHCDLFDADKNIQAMVDLFQEKSAVAANTCSGSNCVNKIWELYVGGRDQTRRVNAFNNCQSKKR